MVKSKNEGEKIMKIEAKLALNNIARHEKRTLFTVISLVLCTTLIFTTVLLVSSIKNGFATNIETEYNDYHLVLKDISSNEFNKIKDKTYIDKLYIQDVDGRRIKSSRLFIYTTK